MDELRVKTAEEVRQITIDEWAASFKPEQLAKAYYDAKADLEKRGEPRLEVADLADLRGKVQNFVEWDNSAVVRVCAHDLFEKGDKTILEVRLLKGDRGIRPIYGRNEYAIGKAEGTRGRRLTSDERRGVFAEFTYSGELARKVNAFCTAENLVVELKKKGIETDFFALETPAKETVPAAPSVMES